MIARVGVDIQVGIQVSPPHDQRQYMIARCPPASIVKYGKTSGPWLIFTAFNLVTNVVHVEFAIGMSSCWIKQFLSSIQPCFIFHIPQDSGTGRISGWCSHNQIYETVAYFHARPVLARMNMTSLSPSWCPLGRIDAAI